VDGSCAAVEHWAPAPEDEAGNPLAAADRTVMWPVDPLADRRADVVAGAALVREELAMLRGPGTGEQLLLDEHARPCEQVLDDDPDGWERDTDVLLAERAAAASRRERVLLPTQLSVSQLVELAADPEALARRLRRPLPYPPNPAARRGTAFHAWLEQRFGSGALLDLDELPGAADSDAAPDADLAELKEAFLASAWADRVPYEVEVPFTCELAGIALRGRMDAVFPDPDGGWTVVDWKTGRPPEPEHLAAVAVQLAAYRVAWADLSSTDLSLVRAAFHYVRYDRTVRPADLLDAAGLRALLRTVPTS
jgi:DNA helicase-2/ATP-dependent DNA helicase PcrA